MLAALFLAPAAHNLIYGHQFVLLPTSAGIPQNLVLPPFDFLTGLDDPGVRITAFLQLRLLLGIVPSGLVWNTTWVTVPMHLLQALFIFACIDMISNWRHRTLTSKLLMLLPLLYLIVQFPFILTVNYPRHIAAGIIAMGYVTMYALSPLANLADGDPA